MIAFEVIGIIIIVPLSSMILHQESVKILGLAIIFTTIAMAWNFIYNYLFDAIEDKLGGLRLERKASTRVLHALGFELFLCIFTLPIIAIALDLTLLEAFIVDIGYVLFYLIYAFIFNWLFDKTYVHYFYVKNKK